MSWWILLLGLVVVGLGVLWSTRLPPSVAVDLPIPPKADPVPVLQPAVDRLIGLWSAPDSHFWSDNLRVAPPSASREETVPHGPRVAEQAGWTRPYLGSKREASVWTELRRQLVVATGVSNPLDKSFATSGVVERFLNNSLYLLFAPPPAVPPTPEIQGVLDGGDEDGAGTLGLDAGDDTTEADIILDGGDVNGL
jgi:hypothetical protein